MKKTLLILLVVAMMLVSLTACTDGKCDDCGNEAVKDSQNATGIEGEYCAECLAGKMLDEAYGAANDMISGLIG